MEKSWCLFEIYYTIESKTKFEIVMSPDEQKSFIENIQIDSEAINGMIASIDLENSESWSPFFRYVFLDYKYDSCLTYYCKICISIRKRLFDIVKIQ